MPKQPIEHILTPETEKRFFTDQILPPLMRGENVTILWLPHGGIRTQMIFLLKNSHLFGYKQLGKYLFVYINPYDLIENSPEGYFQLMSHGLDKQLEGANNQGTFFSLKEKINRFLHQGYRLIFILIEFGDLEFPLTFYNNLHSLYQMGEQKISFIFTVSQNIFTDKRIEVYGQLGEWLLQNRIYFPCLSDKDSRVVLGRTARKYHYQPLPANQEQALKLAGGHPSLIRICLNLLSNYRQKIEEESEVKIILREIWQALGNEEKRYLTKIANDPKANLEIPTYLSKLKLVIKTSGSTFFFSPLFKDYVKKQKVAEKVLSLNEQNNEILIDDIPISEKITLNEYRLLTTFLTNPNSVISRDQISESIWGKDAFEKYSDWAIDQAISLLRKKLDHLGVDPNCLQTIKGRGYRWTA